MVWENDSSAVIVPIFGINISKHLQYALLSAEMLFVLIQI